MEVIFQTDNGSELIGNPKKKGKSVIKKVLERFGVKWVRMPPS